MQDYLGTNQDSPRLVERGGTVYPMKPRASSPRPAEPAPTVPADLAAALAQQYRLEAEQVRGPFRAMRSPAACTRFTHI